MQKITLKGILKRYYDDYKSENPIPVYIMNAIERIMKCKTEYLGGKVYTCPECGVEKEIYNSCRHRCCPLCREKLNKEWYGNQIKRLPNLKYDHIVFTVPNEFNKLYLKDKTNYTDSLFTAVEKSIKKRLKRMKLTSGYILQLHTNGGNQNLHPHIHCLILRGGLSPEGSYISKDKFFIHMNYLINDYRSILIKNLKKHFPEFGLKAFEKVSKRNWNVKLTEDFDKKGKSVLKYLSKSKSGGSISNDRIKGIKDGMIYFTNKEKSKEFKLKGKEFVRRLLFHIPESSKKLVRSYGLFHSNSKEELEKLVKEYGKISEEEVDTKVEVRCSSCKNLMLPTKEIEKLENPNKLYQKSLFKVQKIS